MHRSLRLAALVCALASAAPADEPLRAPEDFIHEYPDGTVTGLADEGRTIISQTGVPGSPNWSIPVWARWYSLGPMGESILVMQEGGNLIGTRDPEVVAATVWYLEGDAVRSKAFPLGALIDPDAMPSTTSNYLLYERIERVETGWQLHMGDGSRIVITYR